MGKIVCLTKYVYSNEQFGKKKIGNNDLFMKDVVMGNPFDFKTLLPEICEADVLVIDPFMTKVDRELLEKCSKLKKIQITTTTNEMMDLKLLKEFGIELATLPKYASKGVAEMTIGMIFALARKICFSDREMKITPKNN